MGGPAERVIAFYNKGGTNGSRGDQLRPGLRPLPFEWTPALGIKCAIFRLNPLEALSGFSDGSSNGEIIRLTFDYKSVSPGREHKVFILWPNH